MTTIAPAEMPSQPPSPEPSGTAGALPPANPWRDRANDFRHVSEFFRLQIDGKDPDKLGTVLARCYQEAMFHAAYRTERAEAQLVCPKALSSTAILMLVSDLLAISNEIRQHVRMIRMHSPEATWKYLCRIKHDMFLGTIYRQLIEKIIESIDQCEAPWLVPQIVPAIKEPIFTAFGIQFQREGKNE